MRLVLAVWGIVSIVWLAMAYRRLRKPLGLMKPAIIILGCFFLYEIVRSAM